MISALVRKRHRTYVIRSMTVVDLQAIQEVWLHMELYLLL